MINTLISEILKRESVEDSKIKINPPKSVRVALHALGHKPKDLVDRVVRMRLRDYAIKLNKEEILTYLGTLMQQAREKAARLSEDHNYAEQGTSMSKSELRDGIKNAIELYRLLQAGHQLPPWAAAYVTLSSDYLHSVNEYMVERAAQSMYQEGVQKEYDKQTIQRMKDWIDDIQWEDLGNSDDLSDEEVIAGVKKHYDGGIKQFMIDIK